jgi:hypothetical protein
MPKEENFFHVNLTMLHYRVMLLFSCLFRISFDLLWEL